MCVSCRRRGRRRTADARGGDAAGRAERSARASRDARRGARVSRKSASRVARVSTVAPRRRRRPTTPTTDARNVDGRAGGILFSRRRGSSGTRPRSAIETAPAGKCARARVPCPVRNKPPPFSGARCRTPRTGTTSDGATRVYFCCESGRRMLYRGRRCRCSSRWRRWRCCTAYKASSRPIAGPRDDTDPSRPRVHASPRPRSSRPDATRRLFPRRLPRKTPTVPFTVRDG